MIRTVARTMRIFLFSAMTRPMQNFLSYDDKFCIEFSRILLWVEIRFLLWLEARIGFLNICNQTLRCLGKFGKMRHPRVFPIHTLCVGKIGKKTPPISCDKAGFIEHKRAEIMKGRPCDRAPPPEEARCVC